MASRDIKNSIINLVSASPEQWELIGGWLEHPVARKYWYWTPEASMQWMHQIVENGTGEILIIEFYGEAIGLAVWDWCLPETASEPKELLKFIEPGTISLGILIPDAQHRNRGIGVEAMRLLEQRSWAIPECRMVAGFSLSDNSAMIRLLDFLDYRAVGTAEEPGVGMLTLHLKQRPQDGS